MSELEAVWSGSTWRSFPPPTLATPGSKAPLVGSAAHRERVGRENFKRVLACLGEDLVSQQQIAHATGLSVTAVRFHMKAAIQDGMAQSVERRTATRQRGESVVWYRKVNA